ncbi:MAG: hypothetical protein K6A38_06955 [Lachnospiraceae bacterium]|nr:hypothetical protein [Lachnospiraceae bacterium]
MSEENLNNGGQQEETAALFINAQKKKKAEEEARKKAEEEQAKRDAAEAEVRRMEQELAEQKRKAEEERKALEEAERLKAQQDLKENIKEGIKEGVKDAIKVAVGEKNKEKSKTAKIVSIAVGAVVVIGIVVGIVFAIINKGHAIDYAELDFDGTYEVKEDGYDLEFAYPEEVYETVTEKASDKTIAITFESKNKKAPKAMIYMFDTEDPVQALQFDVNYTLDQLENTSQEYIEDYDIIDDSKTKISNDPDYYQYEATCQIDEESFGAVASWYTLNEEGKLFFTTVVTFANDKNEESAENMLEMFMSENMDNALKTPGAYPIDKYDWDGAIGIEQVNFKVPVSKDRFQELKKFNNEGERVYVDKNGTIVILAGVKLAEKDGFAIVEDQVQSFYDAFKKIADDGLPEIKADERMFISSQDSPYGYVDSFNEYKTIYNGIDYWERDYAVVWEGKDAMYAAIVYTYVPMETKDKYKEIFDKSIEDLDTYN